MTSPCFAQNAAAMDLAHARAERREFVPKRRRPRAVVACQMCRTRKSKCDQGHPSCSSCLDHRLTCSYPSTTGKRTRKSNAMQGTPLRSATTQSLPNMGFISPHLASIQKTLLPDTSQHAIGTALSGVAEPSQPLEDGNRPMQLLLFDSQNSDRQPELGKSTVATGCPPGLTEVNPYTSSTEFFGPSSNNVFLLTLMAKSQSRKSSSIFATSSPEGEINKQINTNTPVRFDAAPQISPLHNEDYPMVSRPSTPEQHPEDLEVEDGAGTQVSRLVHTPRESTLPTATNTTRATELENIRPILQSHDSTNLTPRRDKADSRSAKITMERECIHQYFQNIHRIIPFIDKVAFLQRCEAEVWTTTTQEPGIGKQQRCIRGRRSEFLSLFNAVCAVGAITAQDEPLFSLFVRKATDTGLHKSKFAHISPPIRIAKVYFERVKLNLGDIFEYNCLESVQALFLMSVFCQLALRPHSCYMYSCMAARAAISIGMTECQSRTRAPDSIKTWWCIYNHEMEICCSSGRDSFLKPAACYQIPLPSTKSNVTAASPDSIIYAMVPVTEILREILETFYKSRSKMPRPDLALTAQKFDEQLREWKENLPPFLSFEQSHPVKGYVIDQVMLLKLRFYNAQILLHRPFLPLVKFSQSESLYARHFEVCIDAARNTLELLHVSYTHRPYLQNWWHHLTYILYASTTIAYALFLPVNDTIRQGLRKDIEKSILLFKSMETISVARKCIQMIHEVVEVSSSQTVNVSLPPHLFASFLNQDTPLSMPPSSALGQHDEFGLQSSEGVNQSNSETGQSILEVPLHHERALPLAFDSTMLDCLIDYDIFNFFAGNSPLGFARNDEDLELLSFDDSIFGVATGRDA